MRKPSLFLVRGSASSTRSPASTSLHHTNGALHATELLITTLQSGFGHLFDYAASPSRVHPALARIS
jgi:hypothetical protein